MPDEQIKVKNLITHRDKCIGGFIPERVDGKRVITMQPSKEPVMFYAAELRKILDKVGE